MRIVTTLSRFLVAAFWTLSAVAGTRFDFVAEAPGYTYKGTMALDDNRLRLDITEGNHPLFNEKISIISREAGTEVLVIDHGSKTYFQRQVGHIAGPLSTSRGLGPTRASRSKFSISREPITVPARSTVSPRAMSEPACETNWPGKALRLISTAP